MVPSDRLEHEQNSTRTTYQQAIQICVVHELSKNGPCKDTERFRVKTAQETRPGAARVAGVSLLPSAKVPLRFVS